MSSMRGMSSVTNAGAGGLVGTRNVEATAPRAASDKRIDLASSGGAGVLGAGVGVLAAPLLGPYAIPLVVVGAALHVWGMVTRHRLKRPGDRVWWGEVLYWLCWAILLAIGALAVLRR